MDRIYLDANATSPLDPRVRDAMLPWLDAGNASSPHAEGRAARDAIDTARERVAALVGARAREILFTSGATEADALALLGAIDAGVVRHVVTTAIEHPAVLRTLESRRDGGGVELLVAPVDASGHVDADMAIPERTGLVSVMLVNNELGTIQPVGRIAARAKERGAVVHSDAAQACGRIPVDVGALGVDLLALSAHKMGGPKGAGALYVRRGVKLAPMFHGGEHERSLRAGTENVAAIVGMGVACELARVEQAERHARWSALRVRFLDRLRAALPDARVNGSGALVPNTISVTFAGAEGEAVLLGLDLEGIAVATGSACSSGAAEPSHVLQAIGLSRELAESSIRVSFHPATREIEIEACVKSLTRVVRNLRALHA